MHITAPSRPEAAGQSRERPWVDSAQCYSDSKYPELFAAIASLGGVLISVRPQWPDDPHPPESLTLYRDMIMEALGPLDPAGLKASDPYELAKGLAGRE